MDAVVPKAAAKLPAACDQPLVKSSCCRRPGTGCESPSSRQTHPRLVGNGHLYSGDSLHNHVRRMANAADPELEIPTTTWKSGTISGSALAIKI